VQREVCQVENTQARAAMRDDGPVLTAMQAAMQAAQADLASQQPEDGALTAEAAPVAEAAPSEPAASGWEPGQPIEEDDVTSQ
ncbi:MAG: hypothetical protein WCQ48_08510, partial [Chloroflexota bacterium]